MIKITSASKSFGKQVVLDDVSLEFKSAGLYVFWGKSGCGKSTLLNIIAGYDTFTSGEITVTEDIMTIFQNYELINELTVYDNIFLGRKPTSENKKLLKKMGISKLMKQYPEELSGGQKQRVGITRALISNPSIICCDEPTESLDVENKAIVLNILKEYAENHIVIMATHQKDTVLDYADYVIQFKDTHVNMFTRSGFTEHDPVPSKTVPVPENKIHSLIHKVIRKKHAVFIGIFTLLLALAQGLSILKQNLFYIPDTHKVLNGEMIYFKSELSQEKLEENGMKHVTKIITFQNLTIDDTEYLTNIYPYVENTENLTIKGDIPSGLNVLINQNTADSLFSGKYENETLTLPFSLGPFTSTLDVTVTGLIEEPDTSAMNIYYNLDDVVNYLSTVRSEDGLPLSSYYESSANLYQKHINYQNMENALTSYEFYKAYNPLFSERKENRDKSQIFIYMFNGIIAVTFVLLLVFIVLYMKKETDSYCKTLVILLSQNLSSFRLKKEYILQTFLPLTVLCLFDTGILFFIQKKITHISVIPLMIFAIVSLSAAMITVFIQLTKLKEDQISTLLKENN